MGQSSSPGSGCQAAGGGGMGGGGRGGKGGEGRPGPARAAGEDSGQVQRAGPPPGSGQEPAGRTATDHTRTWASGAPRPSPRGTPACSLPRAHQGAAVPRRAEPPTRGGSCGRCGSGTSLCRPCPRSEIRTSRCCRPSVSSPGSGRRPLQRRREAPGSGGTASGSPSCDLPGQSLCSDSGLLLKPNIANQAKQSVYLQNVSILHQENARKTHRKPSRPGSQAAVWARMVPRSVSQLVWKAAARGCLPSPSADPGPGEPRPERARLGNHSPMPSRWFLLREARVRTPGFAGLWEASDDAIVKSRDCHKQDVKTRSPPGDKDGLLCSPSVSLLLEARRPRTGGVGGKPHQTPSPPRAFTHSRGCAVLIPRHSWFSLQFAPRRGLIYLEG